MDIYLKSIKGSLEDILDEAVVLKKYLHGTSNDQYAAAYQIVLEIYRRFVRLRPLMDLALVSEEFLHFKNLKGNFSNAFVLSATILADVVECDFVIDNNNLLSFCRLNSKIIVDNLNFVLKDWSRIS